MGDPNKELPDVDETGVDKPGIWDNPLWMPAGSIRSIITLWVVLGFMVYVFYHDSVPQELNNIVLLVVGFYFGSKRQ